MSTAFIIMYHSLIVTLRHASAVLQSTYIGQLLGFKEKFKKFVTLQKVDLYIFYKQESLMKATH